MADNPTAKPDQTPKSSHAEREERVLKFWKEKGIFEKTLNKNKKDGKAFVFFEGPPTANGHPGIHHLEARAFKDAIPRYKTMRGYYVRRKGGWDTHGLPVELQVEKELGLKSKKEIDTFGIAAFNDKCKESVWKYVHEWEDFTNRIGYWVDLKNPYITYKSEYIESLWNIMKTVDGQGLLYKDYKVVPWCPRCGTGLSSHELAQGYQEVKDLSVYVKFKVKSQNSKVTPEDDIPVYLLAWTTTPWTLPGNVGLAVGSEIEYVKISVEKSGEQLILAKSRLSCLKEEKYTILESLKGNDLLGLEYEPLYPFIQDNISGPEKDKLKNAYKVYPAKFVTTEDGTGIVHTAVMYGQDDFELGTEVGLPKYHLVSEDGTFKKETGFLSGSFVKDPNLEVAIIKDLHGRNLLFAKEKYEHTYPFCWRCKTPLIYFARDSWYIKMSALREKLVKENQGIHWEPAHIKDGRFGEWLSEIKDWAISRERYWGTPLPVWTCDSCKKIKVIGSVADVSRKPRNTYLVMRHGQAENNTLGVLSNDPADPYHLTAKGREQVEETCKTLKKEKIDLAFVSPFVRTRETMEIVKMKLGISEDIIHVDERIRELNSGEWQGRTVEEFFEAYPTEQRFEHGPKNGENLLDIKKRMGKFLDDLENQYQGKTILIVTHEMPAGLLEAATSLLNREQTLALLEVDEYLGNAEIKRLNFNVSPHNDDYELDLHRPYIDQVKLDCSCGSSMNRVKEVMDVWFDSGAMPFAQDHYPFAKGQEISYPADYISEAIDQTRGWFYTLHAIGILMGKGKAYKNVICLGHILDSQGKKMSKSVGNIVNPWDMIEKYGADALRYWMYSVNQPGDSKNFEEKTVDETVKKVFNLVLNVLAFYEMYAAGQKNYSKKMSDNILDQWILSRLNKLVDNVTENLDNYVFFEPTRAIRDFVADLSQWYVRRSRDRFKGDDVKDKDQALATTYFVLRTLAKVLAPFTPFLAEDLYSRLNPFAALNEDQIVESVHLEDWPVASLVDDDLLKKMTVVRDLVTKGLEARMKAKINVRQPLQELKIKSGETGLDKDARLIDLIKDEVNVKYVSFDNPLSLDVALDLAITPELREEGEVRELVRMIQDIRKENGLTINDRVVLKVESDKKGQELVHKFKEDLIKTTGLKSITFVDGLQSDSLQIGQSAFKMEI